MEKLTASIFSCLVGGLFFTTLLSGPIPHFGVLVLGVFVGALIVSPFVVTYGLGSSFIVDLSGMNFLVLSFI
jgi:hypothetical protein